MKLERSEMNSRNMAEQGFRHALAEQLDRMEAISGMPRGELLSILYGPDFDVWNLEMKEALLLEQANLQEELI